MPRLVCLWSPARPNQDEPRCSQPYKCGRMWYRCPIWLFGISQRWQYPCLGFRSRGPPLARAQLGRDQGGGEMDPNASTVTMGPPDEYHRHARQAPHSPLAYYTRPSSWPHATLTSNPAIECHDESRGATVGIRRGNGRAGGPSGGSRGEQGRPPRTANGCTSQ